MIQLFTKYLSLTHFRIATVYAASQILHYFDLRKFCNYLNNLNQELKARALTKKGQHPVLKFCFQSNSLLSTSVEKFFDRNNLVREIIKIPG